MANRLKEMERNKKICILILGVVLVLLYWKSPFYIDLPSSRMSLNQRCLNNKYFSLEDLLNLPMKSQLSVFVILTDDDIKDLPIGIQHHRILYTENMSLIKKLLKTKFLNTGGDMSTTDSKIVISQDGRKVFESQILLTDTTIGLQNNITGWIEVLNKRDIINLISLFDKYKYPLLME